MTGPSTSGVPTLPLVGRSEVLSRFDASFARVSEGRGEVVFLSGPDGSGRSRLSRAIRDAAERNGFLTAVGCAFPMESGVPYSLFCDLLDPLLSRESPDALTALTRGAPEFQLVCPSLSDTGAAVAPAASDSVPDLKSRLLWNFPDFLDRLRRDRPLLLVLDDLEWIDEASAELLHFLARQVEGRSFLIVGCVRTGPDGNGASARLVRSLESRKLARVVELTPMSVGDVRLAISGALGVDEGVIEPFAKALHRWTGGNPLFLEASLASLIDAGRVRIEGGRWVGWAVEDLPAPRSIHDLVLRRLERLGEDAVAVAEIAAITGARAGLPLLQHVSGLPKAALAVAIDELAREEVLRPERDARGSSFSFVHPVVRGVLTSQIGPGRSQLLHGRVATALLELEGKEAPGTVREIAAHVVEAGAWGAPDLAAQLLAEAGRAALTARADREAALLLDEALARLAPPASGPTSDAHSERVDVQIDLSRALQRTGGRGRAAELLREARRESEAAEDWLRVARVDRRLALGAFWAGQPDEALAHYTRGMSAAGKAAHPSAETRLRLAAGACLQELARPDEAAAMTRSALELAEQTGDPALEAAAHRGLLLRHTWTGPPATARRHGDRALELSSAQDDPAARFMTHWVLAILAGLTGDHETVREHLDAGWAIARALGSPLLTLQIAEIEIEWDAGLGRWEQGIDLAEETVRMARELDLGINLSRLLVWSGLLHLARGEMEAARSQLGEAWDRIGLDDEARSPPIHLAILGRLGRAAMLLADGDLAGAGRVGGQALELADRSGYQAWGLHRLLPLLIEAALLEGDLDRAEELCRRLRGDSEHFDHRIGLVLADAGEALATWLRGDLEGGAARMAEVAEALEGLRNVPEAARMRRQLAGRFAELGKTDEAIRELRRVHDLFEAMGAEPELDKARGQFREVGSRPPVRMPSRGDALLTEREAEIAYLIAERKSNKAVARALGISPRTVGTHLSNIYKKLEVTSRASLGDLVRAGLLEGR